MGRDIWALKVTRNAKTISDNARPAVLYNAQQHAREWLAGETCKRTLKYFTENYGEDTEAGDIVTPLVDSRELWFVCISNPDGFEYTFTAGNRLWRKNMADNNGDGVRGDPGDGVDPNRNFPNNWGRDNEGSSDDPFDETYRGTGPASEPETRAMLRLWRDGRLRVPKERPHRGRAAAVSARLPAVHGDAGQRDLRGPGRRRRSSRQSPTRLLEDGEWDSVGNRFDPDLGAELYITNGDTLEDAYTQGILAFTPEGSEPDPAKVPPGRPASSSRTTRPTSRRSSSVTGCSRSTSRSRPRTRRIRCRTWATRRATSTSTRSATPTATRSGSRSRRRSRWGRSASAGGSTTGRSRPATRAASTRARGSDGARHLLRPPARSRAGRSGR